MQFATRKTFMNIGHPDRTNAPPAYASSEGAAISAIDERRYGPWLAISAILLGTAALLRANGRRWWCACGHPWLWVSDTRTQHNSQHLLDPYSFTHLSHGLIFFAVLSVRPLRRIPVLWRLAMAVAIEAGWELIENSHFVIERYRHATISLGYTGDSIANSMGDIGCCVLGYLIATRLGVRWSLVLVVLIELILLIWIRDNLTLNVLMLAHPIRAIQHWQAGIPG
jgi:hypothetical protein